MRTDRYRFTIWEKDNRVVVARELYDLQEDPLGNVNIADRPQHAELVKRLTDQHRTHWPLPKP